MLCPFLLLSPVYYFSLLAASPAGGFLFLDIQKYKYYNRTEKRHRENTIKGHAMRDYKMDNMKCFLIFCVVLGHIFELFYMGGGYRIIYSFHMPAFLFISGYFAGFNKAKIAGSLVYPYMVFQTLYLIFNAIVVNKDPTTLSLQYTTPFWLLWYLMVLIFYHLLIPFMDGIRPAFLLIIGIMLSLGAGFDSSIGYYLSLARFFTFLPYFILGMVWRHLHVEKLLKNRLFRLLNVLCVLVSCFILGSSEYISSVMLYGSGSYVSAGYSVWIKSVLFLCGVNWIFFFMWVFPKRRIPIISSIGQNTLTVFLCHGFIRKYLESRETIFIYSKSVNIGLAVLISFVIILILGNKYVGTLGRLIFTGEGIEKLLKNIKKR